MVNLSQEIKSARGKSDGSRVKDKPSRSGRVLKTLAVLGGVLWGVYQYQPQRYDFIPRQLPASNPWTDPDSDRLFSPGVRVTIVSAHPDDAEFYIGGLLTRLAKSGAVLSLVVATDGDKGYYPFEDAARNLAVRRDEQEAAAKMWNAEEVVYLGYPDGRFDVTGQSVADIARELRRLQPEYILAFDGDYPPRLSHGDHRNAGAATERAVKQSGVGKWLLRYSTIAPNFAFDVTDSWQSKLEALAVHKSQFSGGKMNFISNMLAGIATRDGALINTRYAEGVRCTRLVR